MTETKTVLGTKHGRREEFHAELARLGIGGVTNRCPCYGITPKMNKQSLKQGAIWVAFTVYLGCVVYLITQYRHW